MNDFETTVDWKGNVFEYENRNDFIFKTTNGRIKYANGDFYEGRLCDYIGPCGQGKMTYSDGSIYVGNFRDGSRNGKGKITFADGEIYEGNWFLDDCYEEGRITFPSGRSLFGIWTDGIFFAKTEEEFNTFRKESKHFCAYFGKTAGEYHDERCPNGFGKKSFPNGDFYEGNWENGKRFATGTLQYADGLTLSGAWLNDLFVVSDEKSEIYQKKQEICLLYNGEKSDIGLPHGFGKAIFPNGDIVECFWKYGSMLKDNNKITYATGDHYEGEARDLLPCGNGKMILHDGSTYEGTFENGKISGIGNAFYANGDIYEGRFCDGKRRGYGKMIYANGDVYCGNWHTDLRSLKGIMHYANGDVYDGRWKFDMQVGQGKMTYANGDIYEGEWWRNARHGEGALTLNDGTRFVGRWENDVFKE